MREASDLHVESRSPLKRKHSNATSNPSYQRSRPARESSRSDSRPVLTSTVSAEPTQIGTWQFQPPAKRQKISETAQYQERAAYPAPPEIEYSQAMAMAPERAAPRQYAGTPAQHTSLPSYPLEGLTSQNGTAYYAPASPRQSPGGHYERQGDHEHRRSSLYRSQYDTENYHWGPSTFSSHSSVTPQTYSDDHYSRPESWPRYAETQSRYGSASETLPPIRSWEPQQPQIPASTPSTNYQNHNFTGYGHQHHHSNPIPAHGYSTERLESKNPIYTHPLEAQSQAHRPYEYRHEGDSNSRLPSLNRFGQVGAETYHTHHTQS